MEKLQPILASKHALNTSLSISKAHKKKKNVKFIKCSHVFLFFSFSTQLAYNGSSHHNFSTRQKNVPISVYDSPYLDLAKQEKKGGGGGGGGGVRKGNGKYRRD